MSSIMYSKSALRSFVEEISLNIDGKVHCLFSVLSLSSSSSSALCRLPFPFAPSTSLASVKPYVLKEAMQCVMYSAHTVEELQTTSSSATFYGWKYKHYFAIVEVGEKNIRARCKLCVGNKTLSCARNTTSNFKKHLKNVHKRYTSTRNYITWAPRIRCGRHL